MPETPKWNVFPSIIEPAVMHCSAFGGNVSAAGLEQFTSNNSPERHREGSVMGIRTTAGTVKAGAAVVGAISGVFLALMATASPAGAEPVPPVPPPGPPPSVQAAGTDAAPPAPEAVPHLISPDNLPPGATMDRSALGNESPNVSYLKDLYQAVQNQEISGKEAVLYGLAQRGMNTPYPDQAPGPNVPISSPGPVAAPPLAPAPAAPAPALPPPPFAPAPAPPLAPPPPPAPGLPPGLGPLFP